MLDALDLGGSRDAALVRFARSVTGTEAEVLRAALGTRPADEPGSTGGDTGRHRADRPPGRADGLGDPPAMAAER